MLAWEHKNFHITASGHLHVILTIRHYLTNDHYQTLREKRLNAPYLDTFHAVRGFIVVGMNMKKPMEEMFSIEYGYMTLKLKKFISMQ